MTSKEISEKMKDYRQQDAGYEFQLQYILLEVALQLAVLNEQIAIGAMNGK